MCATRIARWQPAALIGDAITILSTDWDDSEHEDPVINRTNANDTDDGFYFVGGLIGGLFIAVAGNIISDRLQDWWRSRSA